MKTQPHHNHWLLLAFFQILILLFFYRSFIFTIDNKLIWGTSDDIYISACYARNMSQGHGLVWYPEAPKVEGFSNPLWVMLLSVLHVLPFFVEENLGLFLIAINIGLLILLYRVYWSIIVKVGPSTYMTINEQSRQIKNAYMPFLWPIAIISVSIPSLPYWMAEGFSVGLIAL